MKISVLYDSPDRAPETFEAKMVVWYVDGDGDLYVRWHGASTDIVSGEAIVARGKYLAVRTIEMTNQQSMWRREMVAFAKEKAAYLKLSAG